MVHAVRTEQEKWAFGLLLDELRADGHELTVITWDRGKSVLDLEALGPVGDIEDVNRWRLPIWLAKAGLAPVARRLRHARMRWWWLRARRPTSVVVLGLLRAEMRHYLPPGAHVGAVLGWRPPEAPESLEETLQVADAVLACDERTAETCRAAAPDVDVAVFEALWARLHWSRHGRSAPPEAPRRAGVSDDAAFVLGLGPANWGGGADQFLAAAGRVRRALPDRPLEFGWLGWCPEGPDFHPYRFDVERLGLGAAFHWVAESADYYEYVRRADVLVLTCRRPVLPAGAPLPWAFGVEKVLHDFALADPYLPAPFVLPADPFEALLEVLEVPVVRFDLPAAEETARGRGRPVTYPDNAALAATVAAALDDRASVVGPALRHLLGTAS